MEEVGAEDADDILVIQPAIAQFDNKRSANPFDPDCGGTSSLPIARRHVRAYTAPCHPSRDGPVIRSLLERLASMLAAAVFPKVRSGLRSGID